MSPVDIVNLDPKHSTSISRGLPPIELLTQIKNARKSLGVIAIQQADECETYSSYTELALMTFDEIEKISSLSESEFLDSRLQTYFPDLDAMTLGLPFPGIFLLAGSTSIGKTSFALNLARNIAHLASKKVIYLSNDCSPSELLGRIWSSMAEIEFGRIATSRLQPEEWYKLGEVINQLEQAPLLFSNKKFGSLKGFSDWLKSIPNQNSSRPALIVLDDLSRICISSCTTKEKMLTTLRSMVEELNLRILLLAQSKPLAINNGQFYPELLDIPCIDIVQSVCDIIWMIHRDEFWNADTSERGLAKLICMKQKNGPVGTIRLHYRPQYSQFTSLED